MAKAKDKKPRARRPKQKEIPGMEANEKRLPDVESAADSYADAILDRKSAGETEDNAKDKLLILMDQNNIERYKMPDGRIILISGQRKPKIIKPKDSQAA